MTLTRLRPSGWVSLGEVSKVAVGAILVSEDWAFYQHKGYDPQQIKSAMKEDWEEGRFARGASTITQQVVRNVFLDKDKNLWRKLKELVLAVRIEEEVGKRRILETYLNIAEWGEGSSESARLPALFQQSSLGPHCARRRVSRDASPESQALWPIFRAKKMTDYARDTVNDDPGQDGAGPLPHRGTAGARGQRPLPFEAAPTGAAGLPSNSAL